MSDAKAGAVESNAEAALAVFSAAGIAAHFLLRPWTDSHLWRDLPLDLVVVLGGIPLVWRIVRGLLARDMGADLLAGVSIVAAALMHQTLVAAIIVLMLSGGETLERLASRRASRVLDALARRMPQVAHRKTAAGLTEVAIADIAVGDELVVLPHELCPVDGVLVEGRGSMDESYLTGEPYQIEKTRGSTVLSGAVNGESALTIRAAKLARDSRYASIMRVMEDAEKDRPELRRLGDQLAAVYSPVALVIAGAAWAASGDAHRFLAVIVVATPCPLLIAIPVAVIGAISLAAARGVIVKNPAILERIGRCRVVILDKTGTLTFGKPSLTEVLPGPGFDADGLLRLAAGLEHYSRHPLAGPVAAAAAERGLKAAEVSELSETPGAGLTGVVDGRRVAVTGRKRLEGALAAAVPPHAPGLECVVLVDGAYGGLLRFRDAARPESRPFLAHLSPSHGVERVLVVSGDREAEVRELAEKVGIKEVHAGQTPEQKLALVRAETAKAQTLFVGDGINDAPALAAATVGIAIGQNSDVTSEAAGAVIMTASIAKLDELLHIGERMRSIALQSAVGGMLLSAVGMLLAASGRLTPLEGAVLQELIDLAAVLNAVRVALPPKDLTDF
ncbi:MAG: cadmium-translocating P-type ATPase [Elusimicrobia bacterium]|nr:cadmium-translocating P-type ATPase [Elusimicrobiota bacterium]